MSANSEEMFCTPNSPKPEDIPFTVIHIVYDKQKQQILTFERLESHLYVWFIFAFLLIFCQYILIDKLLQLYSSDLYNMWWTVDSSGNTTKLSYSTHILLI